ncbi:MAG: hypothetical protein ACREJ2_17710 [Planctomycetota bacterium]
MSTWDDEPDRPPQPAAPRRLSAWWFALIPAILVLGGILFILVLVLGLSGVTRNLQEVVMPGQKTLTFTKTGSYTIFFESSTIVNHRVFLSGQPQNMQLTVTDHATHQPLTIGPSNGSTTYSWGRQHGQSLYEFAVNTPGDYDFAGAYADGATAPQVAFAVGPDITGSVLLTVFGGLGICFGSFVVAMILMVVLIVKRSRGGDRGRDGPRLRRGR